MKASVSNTSFATKSGYHDVDGKLLKVYADPGDDFSISEYESEIEDHRSLLTKGIEANNARINASGQVFHLDFYLDTTKTVSGVEQTVHLREYSLDCESNGTSWNWAGSANPCWRDSTEYTIWSYWPVSANGRSGITGPDIDSGDYSSISFSHTVPKVMEAQPDLLFAYNVEKRNFTYDKSTKQYDFTGTGTGTNSHSGTGKYDEYFDVHFYHALSAVKFELYCTDAATAAALDVHSVTLCVTDEDGNIISDQGLATSGNCTLTGSDLGVGAGFVWTDLDGRKPLHYVYDDAKTSSSKFKDRYASTGNGELFMIPQTASNLTVIIEFSKNGGDNFNIKIKKNIEVDWEAGKYYKYRINVGEMHVPGEILPELREIFINGLKNANSTGEFVFNSAASRPKIKGVTKIGLIASGYGAGFGGKGNMDAYLALAPDGVDITGLSGSQITSSNIDQLVASTSFQFNFLDVDPLIFSSSTLDTTKPYDFGLNGPSMETYSTVVRIQETGGKKNSLVMNNNPQYYAFEVPEGTMTFDIVCKATASSNDGGLKILTKCFMILEVNSDPVPGNFYDIDWDNI